MSSSSTATATAAAASPESWLRRMRQLPCAVLLFVQLLGIVVLPFTESTGAGRGVFSIVQIAVLSLAVFAVRLTPALTWFSLIVGTPALVLTIVEAITPLNEMWSLTSGVLHAIFYFYTGYALIRYMFDDNHVTKDEMYATGACFTVVAWGFAYLYSVIQTVWGDGQFSSPGGAHLTWMELLFLSFTTMTGTGLSDIAPSGSYARSAIMLEQLAGVNYIALVVARLLGLTIARFRN